MRKISEFLHHAADYALAFNEEDNYSGKMKYSCNAVRMALECDTSDLEERIFAGLEAMGCDTECTTSFKNLGYEDGNWEIYEDTQGARYIWLKFAALMAEEQGV